MKLPHRNFLNFVAGVAALASALILSLTGGAQSQTSRAVKIVVPYAPGGGGSVLARVFADQIERQQMATRKIGREQQL
jgi:tripartite-type tricarboxylate transporter receptor subunit TctC